MKSNRSNAGQKSHDKGLRKLIKSNRYTYAAAKRARRLLRRETLDPRKPYRKAKEQLHTLQQVRAYSGGLSRLIIERSPTTKTAVIVHLFYPETWPLFETRLKNLGDHAFDLFVSLPPQHRDFAATILAAYPQAQCIVVPNRGRDVLPFLQLMRQLADADYEYVLKLHSKKSMHRTDGRDWLTDMLDKLLPARAATMTQLFETLARPDTGIVGPATHYISLAVNFPANKTHLGAIIGRTHSKAASNALKKAYKTYGFFEGTMFWARLDVLRPLLEQSYRVSSFEPERGQVDATLAHALERAFCVVAELNHQQLYEMDGKGVRAIAYQTNHVPDWSKVYIKPKRKK